MAAPLIKTKTPGIYKRGSRYVFSYRVNGVQRWESCRTLEEARRAKSARTTDIGRGEFQERSRVTLHEYLAEWIERYQGTGRRGYREETRDEDRRLLNKYALQHFPDRLKLTELSPSAVAGFVAWLCDPAKQRRELADSTVRNALKPLRAALATARREGLVRHNPVTDVALPHRQLIQDEEDLPRPFPNGTMELVVKLVHPGHRLMFELLAATGVRRSEILALEVRHLALDGDSPHVKVRQRVRRRVGAGLVVGPLKSRYARRDVPIPLEMADRLRAHVSRRGEQDLVFTSKVGTTLDPDNLAERVLGPACAEAGVEWAGFHTFRHTVASRLFAAGRNPVQVQRWLGHHSPSFTLDTYVHLLDNDLGEPLQAANPRLSEPRVDVPGSRESVNKVQTDSTPPDATAGIPLISDMAD
jgi:integrase